MDSRDQLIEDLRQLAFDMWFCLKLMPPTWEDKDHSVKKFWDRMHELGVVNERSGESS